MGLMGKLKNILFEEEEVEIPVIEKKDKKVEDRVPVYKDMPRKEEVPTPRATVQPTNFYNELEPAINEEVRLENNNNMMMRRENNNVNVVSERELFKSEKTFNFPAFDEEEFQSVVPQARPTNVMEYERKNVEKRKQEYRKPEKKEEEVVQKNKFKPSPIISPVYGILDKNYTPDEITSRTETLNSRLDVDSVRKKAFGTFEEPKVDQKKEEQNLEDKFLEEKLEKARTIDELLKDSSDDIIDLPISESINEKIDIDEVNESYEDDEITSLDEIDNVSKQETLDEDTLENDLFDLIDSMYENREDGE